MVTAQTLENFLEEQGNYIYLLTHSRGSFIGCTCWAGLEWVKTQFCVYSYTSTEPAMYKMVYISNRVHAQRLFWPTFFSHLAFHFLRRELKVWLPQIQATTITPKYRTTLDWRVQHIGQF